jgi:cation transport ATPase
MRRGTFPSVRTLVLVVTAHPRWGCVREGRPSAHEATARGLRAVYVGCDTGQVLVLIGIVVAAIVSWYLPWRARLIVFAAAAAIVLIASHGHLNHW